MLAKLLQLIKRYQTDIILLIGVILVSLLSFAMGYILAKYQEKEPIRFEKTNEQRTMSNVRCSLFADL